MRLSCSLRFGGIGVFCLGLLASAIAHAQSGTGELGSFNFDGSNPTSGLVATGAPAISSVNSHTPPNSLSFAAGNNYETYTLPSATSVLYTRQYIDISSIGSNSNAFLRLYHGSSELMSVFLNSSAGHPSYYNQATGTTTTMSSTALSTGTIHLVELYVKMSATAGQVICKIDGTTVYTSVATLNTGTSIIDTVRFGQIGDTAPAGWGTTYMDNVDFSAINWIGPINPPSGAGELGSFNFDGSNPTSGLVATGAPAISTLNSHTPPNSLSFPAGNNYEVYTLPSATSVLYTRQYIDISSIGSNSNAVLRLYHGGSELMSIFLNSTDAHPSYYNQATSTSTTMSSTSFPTGSIHLVELYVKMSATAGQVICKIDGTTAYTSAPTLNTGTSAIDTVWFGQIGNTGTPPAGWGTTYMDNVDFSAIGWIGPINVAAAPALSPAPGTYSTAQVVSLTDSTTGANIYYTTDGSTPTSASSLYTQAITVGATQTVQAIAIAPNYANSAITSGNYTIVIPPTLSALSPASGVVGTSVTISGSNFGASQRTSTVRFNGTSATPSSWSSTSIVVPVPTGATTGNVVVTVGGTSSNGSLFTVVHLPAISGLSPTSGLVGTSVTISGSNLGASQGTSTVRFNGTNATPSSWSSTSIVVPVPTGATTGNVVVTVGGNASNGSLFTVVQAPSISGLSPASGVVGTSVTISGSNFGASQGTSTVSFNGTTATPTSWSASSIIVPVPSGATTGNVVVTVGGSSSNGSLFTVIQPPAISGLSPASGTIGISVTISGSNFGASQGTSTVSFNGTNATPTSWSASSIIVPVPSGASTGNVVVTVGGTSSNGSLFTVVQAPAISGLSPASGVVGTSVTIGGTNFGASQGTSTVSFNGTNATPTSWSATSIVVPVPTGATTGNVVVTVGGNSSNGSLFTLTSQANGGPVTFTYDALNRLIGVADALGNAASYSYDAVGNILSISRNNPGQTTIINFSPSSGPTGTTVTINGAGFSTNPAQNTVTFGAIAATVVSSSATQIVVSVPPGAASGPITVVSPNGSATTASSFMVTSGLGVTVITSFNPTIGAAGTPVTISGSGFDVNGANDRLQFNLSPQQVLNAAAGSLSTTVPESTGSGHITVMTPNGKAVSSQDFFIPIDGGSASAMAFTGRISAGDSTTVSLGAGQIGQVIFDASTGDSIDVKVSGSSSNFCSLFLFDPHAQYVTDASCTTGSDRITSNPLPISGTYTLQIEASSSGSVTLTINDATAATDVPVTIDGPPVTVTTTALGNTPYLTFTGSVGQHLQLANSNYSNFTSCTLFLYSPKTSQPAQFNCNSSSLDFGTLTSTGTYRMQLRTGSLAVSTNLQLTNVNDVTGTLAIDGPPVTIDTLSYQKARLSVYSSGGQHVLIQLTDKDYFSSCTITLYDPNGFPVHGGGDCSGATDLVNMELFAPGMYTLVISVYHATVQLTSVVDLTTTIAIDGPPVGITTSAPYQGGKLTFTGSEGQHVMLQVSGPTFSQCELSVYKPNGVTLGTPLGEVDFDDGCSGGEPLIDIPSLPASGQYTIVALPIGPATGSVTMRLSTVPSIQAGTITIDGQPVTISTTMPGQIAYLTFVGTAGQVIVPEQVGGTFTNCDVSLSGPPGTGILLKATDCPKWTTITLPASGTYTFAIGDSFSAGSLTLQLISVPPDVIGGAITVDGAPVTVSFTSPWQGADLTFVGVGGSQVEVSTSSSPANFICCSAQVILGNDSESGSASSNLYDLWADGTYTQTTPIFGHRQCDRATQ
jgi:YD repeat-containing protein